LNAADLRAAAKGALPPNVQLTDIAAFLVRLRDEGGANMLGVLHSLGYTKGILNALRFPENLRLRAFGKYAAIGNGIGVGKRDEDEARTRSAGGRGTVSTATRIAIFLAAARVEILSWFVFVLAPLAPFLFILPGSVRTASVAVAGPVYALAAMSLLWARVTEHPELAM
jgi:hypothetical protein